MTDYRNIIRKKRIQLGMSQNRLAKSIGVTQPFINEIESGRKSPSVEVLFRICDVLQIQIFPKDG